MGPTADRRRSLLLVDDDEMLLTGLGRDLRHRGYYVRTAPTADQALERARRTRPKFAVVDLCISDQSGLDLVERLTQRSPEMVVIVLTGYGTVQNSVAAFHSGAIDFLQKPITGAQVAEALQRAVERRRARRLPSLARAEFEHITQVLEQCDGNVSEAARRLKIARRSLQRKLHKRPPLS
jgi:two-component system response regulator RegA